jgi:hypothetical protein
MKTIEDLKKGDKFKFNDIVFVVTRRFLSEEKPLIAKIDSHIYEEHRFYYEGLEVETIK